MFNVLESCAVDLLTGILSNGMPIVAQDSRVNFECSYVCTGKTKNHIVVASMSHQMYIDC